MSTNAAMPSLAALVAVVLIGCGGDRVEVSADEQPYVDALVEHAAEDPDDKFQLNEDQAECVAPIWVEVIGVDRLRRAGVGPDQLPADDLATVATLSLSGEDGDAMYAALDDCAIDVQDSFYESVAELAGVTSADDQRCVTDAISDDLLKRIVVVGFTTGPDAIRTDDAIQRGLREVSSACPGVPPEAILVLATAAHDQATAPTPTSAG